MKNRDRPKELVSSIPAAQFRVFSSQNSPNCAAGITLFSPATLQQKQRGQPEDEEKPEGVGEKSEQYAGAFCGVASAF
jgi:hypothetical protein